MAEKTKRPPARFVQPGEMLAMDPSRLHRSDTGAFFWLFSDPPKRSERIGDVAVVHIRGELEHHASNWGGESYEGIIAKVGAAISGQDAADAHAYEHKYEDDYQPIEATPPTTIVTCIDSPGGVVAGLNATVRQLQKMRAENPDIRFLVYANEMAASAAYALACGLGDEIVCPRDSAIIGSIGVISTMVSQARKNEKDGYDIALLTSGARKADGHLHAPLSDRAMDVEQARVDKLAAAFFKLASKARGIPVEKIEGLQAGIFLSADAKKRGLVDAIMSFEELMMGVTKTAESATEAAGGNKTDRRVNNRATQNSNSGASDAMPIAIDALIVKTEKALAAEKDPKKIVALASSLDAYKKTKKHIEHTETEEAPDDDEEGDDDDDDEKGKDDEDDDDESAKSSKEEEKSSKASEEDDDEEEESEEKAAKAALALVQSITGMKGKQALGAIQALAATAASTAKDVAELKRQQRGNEKTQLIASIKGSSTAKERVWLEGEKLATVRGFVKMRLKSGFVNTDENALVKPKHVDPSSEDGLPADAREMIAAAVSGFPGDAAAKEVFRTELVKNHIAAHSKHVRNAVNGVRGV